MVFLSQQITQLLALCPLRMVIGLPSGYLMLDKGPA